MISVLQAKQFRNLTQFEIHPAAQINLILGENGSGKTSLLEAIHLLSVGRSFRTRSLKHLVQYAHGYAQVVAKSQSGIPVGLQYDVDKGLQIRLNNAPLKRMSDLAVNLPLQFIPPNCHQFFELGPKFRRKLIDWGLFHVEPSFNYHWQSYKRALQQRNAAIKARKPDQEITLWDKYLLQHGEQITLLRREYLQSLMVQFTEFFSILCPTFAGKIFEQRYAQGWNKDLTFEQILQESLQRDRILGYTRSGPHAADWSIRIDGADPAEQLSRGQQKLFYLAVVMAQIKHNETGKDVVLLLDDLSSELDQQHQQLVLNTLQQLSVQSFITSTNATLPSLIQSENNATFHVKHGVINSN